MAEPKALVITFHCVRHASAEGLTKEDRELLAIAAQAATAAYAPYSRFRVGAALRFADGRTFVGANQENASFPAGTCAERAALHGALSAVPDGVVSAMAITTPDGPEGGPVAPCGICRQVLLEQEFRQGAPVRLLLGTTNGPVFELESSGSLLPLSFDASFLPR